MITNHQEVLRAARLVYQIQDCDRALASAQARLLALADKDQFWTIVSEINPRFANEYVSWPIAKSLVLEMIKKTRDEAIASLSELGIS